jgi:hypothetical protein
VADAAERQAVPVSFALVGQHPLHLLFPYQEGQSPPIALSQGLNWPQQQQQQDQQHAGDGVASQLLGS